METRRWRSFAWAALVLFGMLAAGPSETCAESPQVQANRMKDLEQALKRAAVNSPRWHSKQASIQRDVHDIGYLLERAFKAARSGNGSAGQDYARQAWTLLQRAITKGHFLPEDVGPVMEEIRRLIPNPPV